MVETQSQRMEGVVQSEVNAAIHKVAEALVEGFPLVLVAGQSFDSLSVSNARVLPLVRENFGMAPGEGWLDLLSRGVTATEVNWLSERFERSVPSSGALEVGNFPWSAVFTSNPDQKFSTLFSTKGRQPEEVLSATTFPRVPRSKSRPPIYYLYGKADQSYGDWGMPKSRVEYLRRTQVHVSEMLNRLSDTATARGVVVISGLLEKGDWLDIDSLLVAMMNEVGPQIVYVGGRLGTPVAVELRNAGRLYEVDGDLSRFLEQVAAIGGEALTSDSSPGDPGTITSGDTAVSITPAMRLRVEASASIVDDEWTRTPEYLDPEEFENAFRQFHGGLGGYRNLVSGILRGFAITRDFEEQFDKSIDQNIERLSQLDGTIVLFGQSGTGKTIALARQIVRIRESVRLPVLVATNRLPTFADVEGFCDEVEREGIEATVLICDANLPAYRYRDFSAGLRSRGRRVVLVGTSYESEDYDSSDSFRFVHAPSNLSQTERDHLSKLLKEHKSEWLGGHVPSEDGSSFLAMLYRSISPGREKIASGLTGEARHWERELRTRAKRAPRPRAITGIAEQLIQLGIASKHSAIFAEAPELEEQGADAAAKLLDYVMVAGRLNCPVPLNLLMRVVTSGQAVLDLAQVAFLFTDLDIFRWKAAGEEGADLYLAPRIQIEAELICARRLGDVGREIDLLVELIRATKIGGVDSSSERNFLLDLLQKLDREGPRKDAYKAGFLRFADALRELRLSKGVFDASLMLRESVFRRQTVWSLDGQSPEDADLVERLPILEDARSTIDEALALIEEGKVIAPKKTRLNLLSERASIYGYLAVQRAKGNDPDGAWSDYLAARVASSKAIAQSDGYYPFDIALWTSSDMLRTDTLSSAQRAEVVAEIYATMDIVDSDAISSSQKIRFQVRKNQAASLVEDVDLEEESIESLKLISPSTAAYLCARKRVADLLVGEDPLSADQRKRAEDVGIELQAAIDASALEDVRCQRLVVQCMWIAWTGHRLFRGERAPTPGAESAVRRLLAAVRRLNDLSGDAARNQDRYLEAVLAWISKDFSGAAEIWRKLSHDSDYEDRSRIRRRLILTDDAGAPCVFTGRIESGSPETTWRLRLAGINAVIPLSHHEFSIQDLAIGREVRGVGVAFNYVGPIADPLVRVQRRK